MAVESEADVAAGPLYPARALVYCADASRARAADELAGRLGLARVPELPADSGWLALVFTRARLQVQLTGPDAPGPVYADFVGGPTARRGRQALQADEGLLRAAGARQSRCPRVIDATGGLGRDAWVLAAAGCEVVLVERHPAVAALLADALERAAADPHAAPIAARLTLVRGDAREALAARTADAVTLDPMHPPRRKSAAVKKEMRVFRALVGADDDSDRLLPAAIAAARRRVVVKRPSGAPALAGPAPSGAIAGRATRFDIYPGAAPDAT